MSTTSVGQIGLDLVVNQKQFNKQIKGVESLASKAGKTLAAAFAVKQVANFGKECVKLGSDLQEVQNVVDVTFPSMSATVDKFAKDAASSFGLSETMAKRYTGTFGAMAKAFGFTEKSAYEMGSTLTGLAGDVASFYNLTQDEAYTKLKSVFTGETESLKELGVVMTQTALDSYALANGFGKTVSSMSEAEKVALRYAFVQSQLSAAQGDFSRTSDSWANQLRELSLRFESLKATIGQGLIAAFTPVIKVLNTVLLKVQGLADAFKNLMEGIFGVQMKEASSLATAAQVASEAASSTAGSTGKTAENLKKANKFLAGFDVINKATSTASESGSGSAGGATLASGSSGTGGISSDSQSGEIEKKFKVISDALGRFQVAFGKLTETVKNGLSWAFENILIPLGKWTMNEAVPRIIDLFTETINIFNGALKAFQPIWDWIWKDFLEPIAKFTGAIFIKALDGIYVVLSKISGWMQENQSTVTLMEGAVLGFMSAWKLTELFAFIQMSGGLASAFKIITSAIYKATAAKLVDKAETLYLTALYAKDFIGSIVKTVVNLGAQTGAFIASTAAKVANTAAQLAMTAATVIWNGVCAIATTVTSGLAAAMTFLTSPIGLVIIAITAAVAAGVLLYKNWDEVKEFGLQTWARIQEGIASAVEKIKAVFATIVGWFQDKYSKIQGVFSTIGQWFGTKFQEAYNALIKPFKQVESFFENIRTAIKDKFKAIGTTAGDAIGGAFKSVMNGILGTIERTINKAIGFINTAIGVLNAVPGVNISKVKTVSLPRLAEGGYVKANSPQLAIIGDNRHHGEIVAPENKLAEMAKMAAGSGGSPELLVKIIELLEKLISLVQDGDDIVIMLDGEELARAMQSGSLRLKRRYTTVEVTV